MGALRIFISHHHEEKLLAQAWQLLIRSLTEDAVVPWYSSDDRVSGGVTPGEWRPQITKAIADANTILVLITPVSNDTPWVLYESGLASAQHKTILPVFYFMKPESLNQIFQTLNCYRGDERGGSNGVQALCNTLMRVHLGANPSDEVRTGWEALIERYLETVGTERTNSYARMLFLDRFHNFHFATTMEGDWFSTWTVTHTDAPEEIFEVDRLFVWTTRDRLRVVGTSTKAGLSELSKTTQEAARMYPMEGVVSGTAIALSYWSSGAFNICGTALLLPRGSSGEVFVGTWQGYTTRNLNEDAQFMEGRVVMSRSKEFVEKYFADLKRSSAGA